MTTNHVLEKTNTVLQELFTKLKEVKLLNQFLVQHIDEELAKHCQVVRFEKNCLFIITENGNWTTQLRFQIPTLMMQLKQYKELGKLSGIICKTRPALTLSNSRFKKRSMARLTEESVNAMLASAQTIQDPKLRKILERIASYKR